MYIALLLLTLVRGEWVEISQQHYVKPLRNGFAKHPLQLTQAQKPINRIHVNNTVPNYNWDKDMFEEFDGIKVIGGFSEWQNRSNIQDKHIVRDDWNKQAIKSVIGTNVDRFDDVRNTKKGSTRRVYITSTEDSKVTFKDDSLEVLNLSDLEYSTEDTLPTNDLDRHISQTSNNWFSKHVSAKIPAVKFKDSTITDSNLVERETSKNVFKVSSNVPKDIISKSKIIFEDIIYNDKVTNKKLEGDSPKGNRNKIIVMTTKNPDTSTTLKTENFEYTANIKGAKDDHNRNSVSVHNKSENKISEVFVSKISNMQVNTTKRPTEVLQTTKPARKVYEPIPRLPIRTPEDVMMEELLNSEESSADNHSLHEGTSKQNSIANDENKHTRLQVDKNKNHNSLAKPSIEKANDMKEKIGLIKKETNITLNSKQPTHDDELSIRRNKIKVIKSDSSSTERTHIYTDDISTKKHIITDEKSKTKIKNKNPSEIDPFTENTLSEVRMVTSKEKFTNNIPDEKGMTYPVYSDESSNEKLSKYEEIDLDERTPHPIRGIVTKVILPKIKKISGVVNNNDRIGTNIKNSLAKRPFQDLHSIYTDDSRLEKEHRHISVETILPRPIQYSSATEKYSDAVNSDIRIENIETVKPVKLHSTENYDRTHYDSVKVLSYPKPEFITKEKLQNSDELRNNFETVINGNASGENLDTNDTPVKICKNNLSNSEGDCDKPTTSTDNEEETNPDEKSKQHAMENLLKYLKIVTDTISRNTKRNFKGKVRYLENLRNSIWASIEERIEAVFPDDHTQPPVRRQRSAEARGHVEFPSSESALMTISFLTFAVYLIKLVLQVIQAYKNKTMMVPAVVATVGRAYQHSRSSRHRNGN